MDAFTKKTIKTSRGYTYTYYTHPGSSSHPTLLFQHGWPDNAALWTHIATPLLTLPFPIIIPDMLGYSGTSKPTDPQEYAWSLLTNDIIDILNTEGADKVISIGHDWGSACASRMYHYHPNRVVGLVNISAPYMAPSRDPWDLESINRITEKVFGYPFYSYWSVFAAKDGPELLRKNTERLYRVMHGRDDTMKKFFCQPGAMREFLEQGNAVIELRPYAENESFKKDFIERMTHDGFEGPQCWYMATNEGYQYESDKSLAKDVDVVTVPALYIGATDDAVCRPDAAKPLVEKGLLPDYTETELIEAGHWVPYEKPEEIVERLRPWLIERFLS